MRNRQLVIVAACIAVLALGAACAKKTTSVSASPSPYATVAPAAAASSMPHATASSMPHPSATAMAVTTVHEVTNAKFGKILVDASGMTLYHFDKDKGSKIACTGACATTWPPLLLHGSKPTGATGLGVVTRPEGTRQVTYDGQPLYRYSGDSKAGETNGNGIAGLWHVTKVS